MKIYFAGTSGTHEEKILRKKSNRLFSFYDVADVHVSGKIDKGCHGFGVIDRFNEWVNDRKKK